MTAIEFPEFGMTMVVDRYGRVDYVAWEPDDDDIRADESDSQPDET